MARLRAEGGKELKEKQANADNVLAAKNKEAQTKLDEKNNAEKNEKDNQKRLREQIEKKNINLGHRGPVHIH